jgi:hypothetical protein
MEKQKERQREGLLRLQPVTIPCINLISSRKLQNICKDDLASLK